MRITMIEAVHPALFYIIGSLILPIVKRRPLRDIFILTIPILSFLQVLQLPEGQVWTIKILNYYLLPLKVDRLSLVFSYVFIIASFTGFVYALHVKTQGEHISALMYVGGTLGVTFAGDWITLLIGWELMAIASVFLIWYRRTPGALKAGFRYIMVHLVGGTLLLAGIALHVGSTASTTINRLPCEGFSAYLILTAFLINAAVPPLHAWLTDAYPEATVTGSVFLSAFTTKSAVYILLRVFPGAEILVWLGTIMALYGIVYAVLENDIRRLLSYHIVSQVGYMVCGVGLGSPLALNGSAAHAFCHILYKALLFMGVGVVIEGTGESKLTKLQGRNLYRELPFAFYLYMIGAFSISGVPLFNGFISKTMVVTSAGEIHRPLVHLLLHLASIGTFLHTGLKLPYGTWFGKAWDRNKKKESRSLRVPLNMYVAMAFNAALCVAIGIYPTVLYRLLPYEATYHPYTLYSVVTTIQLLLFTLPAFWMFLGQLVGEAKVSIDTDWFYRRGADLFFQFCISSDAIRSLGQRWMERLVMCASTFARNPWSLLTPAYGKAKKIASYDPDEYRQAIGVGIALFLALFSLLLGLSMNIR